MMKVISWNCRGLGHPSKIVFLKDLIDHEKPGILILQETKQGHQEMKGIIDQLKQYEGYICESRGASGKIVTIWNQSTWTCISNTITRYWIKVNLENQVDNK